MSLGYRGALPRPEGRIATKPTGEFMRRDQALLMTKVIACVMAVGVLLSGPVAIEESDELEPGLLFATLLVSGLIAGLPVLASAVVHGWVGRADTWTPLVASSAVVAAGIILMSKGGRPGSLIPTAFVLIAIYTALMFVGVWVARRTTGRGGTARTISAGS
ncbi:MAG: hypothetical protein ABWX60_05865 [Aeromicrobium sp.]